MYLSLLVCVWYPFNYIISFYFFLIALFFQNVQLASLTWSGRRRRSLRSSKAVLAAVQGQRTAGTLDSAPLCPTAQKVILLYHHLSLLALECVM